MSNVEKFLDKEGRINNWPTRKGYKKEVLNYLAGKYDFHRKYSEKEINEIIIKWHTFEDYFLLRRELVDNKLLLRTRSGSEYWKEEILEKEKQENE